MYKLSVPIMASTVTPSNRDTYVSLCREAGVARVLLAIASIFAPIPKTLFETVSFFKRNGFSVGIWIDTIGHGSVLTHVTDLEDTPSFQPLVSIDGNARAHTCCPLDENFRAYVVKTVSALASSEAEIIMLDDDFRMAHGALFCGCPLHLARIEELLGERVTAEQLKKHVQSGKPNRYRDAWLTAQNEGLAILAKDIRRAVDAISPDVTVSFCTCACHFDTDGTDVAGITRILAGKNKPLLRLSGAPYWAIRNPKYSLISVIETARMFAAFMHGTGFEIMSEGDVYPRPRYTCPASYLELFDAAMRADGSYDGILKYMFDYVAGPEMETGYLALHKENTAFHQQISALFGEGANVGVRVHSYPHTFRHADLDLSVHSTIMPMPVDGALLGSCGIPTVYTGKGLCNAVFGDNARLYDLSLLSDGTVLDAVSAILLTERGVDVGLRSYGALTEKTLSYLCTADTAFNSFIDGGEAKVLTAELSENVVPLLFTPDSNGLSPVAYRYENAGGKRFFVLLFEGVSLAWGNRSGLLKNHPMQRVLTEAIPWVARTPLPAVCTGNPELYMMCKEEKGTLSIALFNCFADRLTERVIMLGEKYERIECFGCQAILEGDRVILSEGLYGFTAALIRLYKD